MTSIAKLFNNADQTENESGIAMAIKIKSISGLRQ